MSTSSIPAFKAALQTQLRARAGLLGVQVSYGYPGPLPETEYIWLADVRGSQALAQMGRRSREEDFSLTVLIKTEVAGVQPDDQRTATERAFTLMGEIEAQLRTDPAVNGTVRVAQVEGPLDLVELVGNAARGALLTVTVHAEQRI